MTGSAQDLTGGPANLNSRSQLLPRWGRASWQVIGIVAVVYLGLLAIGRLRLVVVPVFVAVLVATQLVPVNRWFRYRRMPDLLAAWATFLVLLILAAFVILTIVPSVSSESDELRSSLIESSNQIKDWLVNGPINLSNSSVENFTESLSSQASQQEGRLIHGALDKAPVVVESLAAMILTFVLVFFFLKDGDRIFKRCIKFANEDRRDGLERFGVTVWRVLTAYVRGSAANGVVNAVVLSTALLILGIPLVIPIAAFTFFGSFLPVIGAIVSGGLAAMIALVESGPAAALVVIGVTVLIHHLESYVVGPIVMRRAVHLDPVAVILSIAVGSLAFGLMGAFLAVPVVAIAMAALEARNKTSTRSQLDPL